MRYPIPCDEDRCIASLAILKQGKPVHPFTKAFLERMQADYPEWYAQTGPAVESHIRLLKPHHP